MKGAGNVPIGLNGLLNQQLVVPMGRTRTTNLLCAAPQLNMPASSHNCLSKMAGIVIIYAGNFLSGSANSIGFVEGIDAIDRHGGPFTTGQIGITQPGIVGR